MFTVLLSVVLLSAEPASFMGVDTMVTRCNTIRGQYKRRSLEREQSLTNAAQDHANYMSRFPVVLVRGPDGVPTYHNSQFSHNTNGGTQYRAQKYGWNRGAQEIIAMQPRGWRGDCWVSWKFSPNHFSAILGNHTHCGFGVAVSADGCVYCVGLFGTKQE